MAKIKSRSGNNVSTYLESDGLGQGLWILTLISILAGLIEMM